jgi:hypothetical protein
MTVRCQAAKESEAAGRARSKPALALCVALLTGGWERV